VHPEANCTEQWSQLNKSLIKVKKILKTENDDVFWVVSDANQANELIE